METALADAHLRLCDPRNEGRPGLNFIALRSVRGIAEQRFNPANWAHGSLHPNERGHAAMLRTFESGLPDPLSSLPTRMPVSMDVTNRRDAALQTPPTLSAEPQCDLLDTSTAGCRTQGMQWTKRQLRAMLLTQGWLVVVALSGAWLVAVAAFGNRCRLQANRTPHGS